MVNDRFRAAPVHGFGTVDARATQTFTQWWFVNRKFTLNQTIRVSGKFSAYLPQYKHFGFIDGC
jgi:hypothetical protein